MPLALVTLGVEALDVEEVELIGVMLELAAPTEVIDAEAELDVEEVVLVGMMLELAALAEMLDTEAEAITLDCRQEIHRHTNDDQTYRSTQGLTRAAGGTCS